MEKLYTRGKGMASHLIITMLLLMVSTLAARSTGVAVLPDESNIQKIIYVSSTGSDETGDGSVSKPFASVGQAWFIARDTYLVNGIATKIYMYNGTYNIGNGQIKCGELEASLPDLLKKTTIVFEGQSQNGVIITNIGATTPNNQILWFFDKQNVVFRNFTMKAYKTAISLGQWDPMVDCRYILFDRVSITECANGLIDFCAIIQGFDVTVKNCDFSNNYGRGVNFTVKNLEVQNSNFNNNVRSDGFDPGYLAGLNIAVLNAHFSNCHVDNNKQFGLQQDLNGKNVVFDTCTFNGNGDAAFKWEIAEGPVTCNSCDISNNLKSGAQLETVWNFYFNNCKFIDNALQQVFITWKNRSCLYGSSCVYQLGGTGNMDDLQPYIYGSGLPEFHWDYYKAIEGTRNININHSCLMTTKGANSLLYARRDDTNEGLYQQWVQGQFKGDNNTYYNSASTTPFEATFLLNPNVFVDLATWKTLTGQDGNSTWNSVCTAVVCNATGVPSAPSVLGANGVTNNLLKLAWTDNASNENGYIIQEDAGTGYVQVASLPANSTSYTRTGLTGSKLYKYQVLAQNCKGNSAASNAISVTTLVDPQPADCSGATKNLAAGKTAIASSVRGNGSNTAAMAVDGNASTRWESEYSDPQWLQIDLTAAYKVCKVVLKWEFSSGKSYKIQVSNDATTWIDAYSTTNGAGGTETIDLKGLSSGRYIRLYCSQRATTYGISLYEMEVYGILDSPSVPVSGVSIAPASISVAAGSSTQLSATVTPSNATNPSVTWSSSNTAVVTVSATGLITGVAAGSATITLTTTDQGKTATSAVTVTANNVAVTGVSVSPTTASVTAGGTQQLTATVSPNNATNKSVSWTTSNSAVATVSSTGLVTGVGAGSATITVTTTDQGKTASSSITVTAPTANCTVNSALNKTATASSVRSNGSNTADKAFDGNGSTRWESEYSDAQWLQIDLGSKFNICEVKITWEYASAASYNIQVSDDATTWTTIKSYSNASNGRTDDLTGLSGAGRYVRMQGVTRTSPYGYSIYEMAVYGSAVSGAGLKVGFDVKSTAHVAEVQSPTMLLYPNPVTNGIFSVELRGIIHGTNASIEVYDMSSKLVLRSNTTVHDGQAIFNIDSQLQNGIYIVHVVAGNQLWNKKMVIR